MEEDAKMKKKKEGWGTYMIYLLMRQSAVVLEDVVVVGAGCGGEFLDDGLVVPGEGEVSFWTGRVDR